MDLQPKRHAILDLETPLGEIPYDWLRYVEPSIMRAGYLPCWVWIARLNNNGQPYFHSPYTGKFQSVARFVAAMFWDYPDEWYVTPSCNVKNCLNPKHLVPSPRHPRWYPPAPIKF